MVFKQKKKKCIQIYKEAHNFQEDQRIRLGGHTTETILHHITGLFP